MHHRGMDHQTCPPPVASPVLQRLRADGELIRATQAVRAAGLPRIDASTVTRWCMRGVRGVRLEAVRIGGAWHTTTQAVERFIAAQQPAEPDAPLDERTVVARRRAAATAALKARGLSVGGSTSRSRGRR